MTDRGGDRARRARHERAADKQPVQGATVPAKKRPVPGAPMQSDGHRLVFALQLVDHGGPYAWAEISPADTKMIATKCKGWESLTADEVFAMPGNKPIPLDSLCAEAKARLEEIELDDEDYLWELHVSGTRRIWGVRYSHIYYIVWWDPNHQVCPSHLRNT